MDMISKQRSVETHPNVFALPPRQGKSTGFRVTTPTGCTSGFSNDGIGEKTSEKPRLLFDGSYGPRRTGAAAEGRVAGAGAGEAGAFGDGTGNGTDGGLSGTGAGGSTAGLAAPEAGLAGGGAAAGGGAGLAEGTADAGAADDWSRMP